MYSPQLNGQSNIKNEKIGLWYVTSRSGLRQVCGSDNEDRRSVKRYHLQKSKGSPFRDLKEVQGWWSFILCYLKENYREVVPERTLKGTPYMCPRLTDSELICIRFQLVHDGITKVLIECSIFLQRDVGSGESQYKSYESRSYVDPY